MPRPESLSSLLGSFRTFSGLFESFRTKFRALSSLFGSVCVVLGIHWRGGRAFWCPEKSVSEKKLTQKRFRVWFRLCGHGFKPSGAWVGKKSAKKTQKSMRKKIRKGVRKLFLKHSGKLPRKKSRSVFERNLQAIRKIFLEKIQKKVQKRVRKKIQKSSETSTKAQGACLKFRKPTNEKNRARPRDRGVVQAVRRSVS